MTLALDYTPAQRAFRAEVRAWMTANVPREPLETLESPAGFAAHREWERTLARGRFGMVTWPEEYGGRGCDLIEWLIFEEEYYRANAPARANQNGIFLLGPTLMEFGTSEQKARFLPRMAAGEEMWAQAWSEPQAGSDLAALRATAVRDGEEYVLRGHKIWSSRAAYADWCFGMFRTDPASERHRGISFILFPLDLPGVRVRGIPQIHGETGFAEIFFEHARVPVANRLGAEGEGWQIAMATAGFERGLMLRSPARFQATAARLVDLYLRHTAELDAAIGSQVAQAWMDAEAYALNTYMTASRLMAGGAIGVEASLNKIFWSELDVAMHECAMRILGARGQLLPQAPDAGDVGAWLEGYMFSLAGPIYAGTNEIQRNIIAERLMKLPAPEAAVDFTFTDEQRMMAASVRELLEDVCGPAALRAVAEGRDDAGAGRWARYRELGLPGLLAPESAGGLGLAPADFVLIAEEAGRAAVPEALVEHAGVAVPLLAEHATDPHVAPVLDGAAAGEQRVAVSLPPDPFAAGAGDAQWLLLGAGEELHLVPRSKLTLVEQPANDRLRQVYRVDHSPVAGHRIAGGRSARDAISRAFDRGVLFAAAQCLGLAGRMLEIGVAYASERRQFGQPVGAYQGLKHQFASAQVKLEFARPVVYAAAARVSTEGERAAVAVSHAKLAAVAAAEACARIAMQAHGAMGYSWEVDLHFYMKRAWALAGAWGDGNFHARRVQSALWSGQQPLGPGYTFTSAEG